MKNMKVKVCVLIKVMMMNVNNILNVKIKIVKNQQHLIKKYVLIKKKEIKIVCMVLNVKMNNVEDINLLFLYKKLKN